MERGQRGSNRGNRRGRGFRRGYNNKNWQQKRQPPRIDASQVTDPKELPIYKSKEKILNHISKYSIGIIEASTGSGKSTQVPQFILEKYPASEIIVAQTSKLGANTCALRIAEELKTHVGEIVGTIFKGESKISKDTRIFFTTTDILLESALNQDFNWDFVILDEVHERSLETDLLLAVLKMRLDQQAEFKLILMSATILNILQSYFSDSHLNGSKLQKKEEKKQEEVDWEAVDGEEEEEKINDPRGGYLNDSEDIYRNDGRLFEIEEVYLDDILSIVSPLYQRKIKGPQMPLFEDFQDLFDKDADTNPLEVPPNLIELACDLILTQHLKLYREENQPYTFMVFLPGLIEINLMNDILISVFSEKYSELDVVIVHNYIAEEEYSKIFSPPEPNKRRVILSSTIAESSITLVDVRFIIDFGMNRETAYNTQRNSDSFELVWASKAIMKQRAGRAGRVANGIVFRFMPTQFFRSMLYAYSKPEVQRSSIDKIILKLKLKNIENIRNLLGNIIEAPDDIEIQKTEKFLVEMGGLHPVSKKITRLGEIYSEFPFEIRVTRLCMFGILFRCFKQTLKIGALLSLERGPFKNLSGLPGNQCKLHPETYRSRLIFHMGSNSDLLMMMNAYDKWYEKFGKAVKRETFVNGHRVNNKHKIPEIESKFCSFYYLDPFIMREALCQYCEIKEKFLGIGLDPRHLQISSHTDEITLKLCIAATFSGKYLISNYAIMDQVNRERLIGKIGPNSECSLLIPDLPECVNPGDIQNLLKLNQYAPKSVSIIYSNAVIEYNKNVNPNTMKFVMWLGNYSKRYYNIAWVIMKRVTRNNAGKIIMKSLVNLSIGEISKVPISQRREGNVVDIASENTPNGVVTDEIVFLNRPEYPFLLEFKDLITNFKVIVEDDSVNAYSFTEKSELAEKFMLVCSQYLYKKNLTIGKNTTLMPFMPLLPHILSLIFCNKIEYVPNGSKKRYHSLKFLNNGSMLRFDYTFTSEDAKFINKIRSDLNSCLGNRDFIENAEVLCDIKNDILAILNKKRIPIIDEIPDWKEILNWKTHTIPYEPQLDTINSIRLLEIEEDSSFYYNEEELEKVKIAKIEYVRNLENLINIASSNKTEIVCKECNESICGLDGIEDLQEKFPIFSINPYYGVVRTVEECPYSNDFIKYVLDNYRPTSWEVCHHNHVVAWNEDNYTFVCEKAPIAFKLPTLKFFPFTKENWANGFQKIRTLEVKYKAEYNKLKFNLTCNICELDFKSNQEFYAHINKETHQSKVKIFLEPYVSI